MREAEALAGFKSIIAAAVATSVGLVGAALIAVMALTIAPRQAEATPQFAQQTKLPCGQCHTTPGGGGKLKPFGQKFKDKGNRL